LVVVICGCFGSFGIALSALFAQPAAGRIDVFPPVAFTNSVCGLSRRRRENSSPSDLPDASADPSASYSRYSSDNQREASITDQQRKCRETAAANGDVIAPELEFYDQAVSGTKLHRAGLDAMLAAAEAGRFHTLYFHNLSRLARESVITMPMLEKLVHVHKVRIISATEGIDSNRDGWEVMATIFSVLHEHYIKDLSANVFRGQEGTVLAGWCGARPL